MAKLEVVLVEGQGPKMPAAESAGGGPGPTSQLPPGPPAADRVTPSAGSQDGGAAGEAVRQLGALSPTLGKLVQSIENAARSFGGSMVSPASPGGAPVDATIIAPPIAGNVRQPPVQSSNVAGAAGGAASSRVVGAFASPLAVAGIAVTGFSMAVRKAANVIESETGRLANYSPVLAGAEAQTDLTRERAAMRRAAMLGPRLAEAERTRARLEDQMARTVDNIYDTLLMLYENIAPAVDAAVGAFGLLNNLQKDWNNIKRLWFTVIFRPNQAGTTFIDTVKGMYQSVKDIRDWLLGRDDEDPLNDPFIKEWLGVDPQTERNKGRRRRQNPP